VNSGKKFMDPLEEHLNVYQTGRIVEASRAAVEKALLDANRLLGFKAKDYDFKIVPLNENGTAGASNSFTGEIHLPSATHEAVILHEAAHLACAKNGASYNILCKDTLRNWFGKLLNETFAEGAAAQKYGYSNPDKYDLYCQSRGTNVEALASLTSWTSLGRIIAAQHIAWEKSLGDAHETRLADGYFSLLGEMAKTQDKKAYKDAPLLISMSNASRLLKKGIKIGEIVKSRRIIKCNALDFYATFVLWLNKF